MKGRARQPVLFPEKRYGNPACDEENKKKRIKYHQERSFGDDEW